MRELANEPRDRAGRDLEVAQLDLAHLELAQTRTYDVKGAAEL